MNFADTRTRAQMLADLGRQREHIERLTAERNELASELARCRADLEHMTEARACARSDANRLAEQVNMLRAERDAGAVVVDRPRREMCATLAECSGNRAAAEKVSRVVAS